MTQHDFAITEQQKLHMQYVHKAVSPLLFDCIMQARTNRARLLNSACYLCQHQDSRVRLPADLAHRASQRLYDSVQEGAHALEPEAPHSISNTAGWPMLWNLRHHTADQSCMAVSAS